MKALVLLHESIKKIPANVYALGVVGIVAAAAICVRLVGGEWLTALAGGVAVLTGMVVLRIFAEQEATARGKAKLSRQQSILIWSCLLIFLVVATMLMIKLWTYLFPGTTTEKVGVGEVSLDISLLNDNKEAWRSGVDTTLTYTLEHTDHGILIQRVLGYSSKSQSGGPIKPLNYITPTWCPFKWDFPRLDFKILNSSPNTVYLTEVVFDIEESSLDPTPLIAIRADTQRIYAKHFWLVNEGWSDLRDMTVRFRLVPGEIESESQDDERYPFTISIGTLTDCKEVWVTEAFQKLGVDFDGLERLSKAVLGDQQQVTIRDEKGVETQMSSHEFERRQRRCLGPFTNWVGTVVGEMDFTWADRGKVEDRRIRFRTPVYLFNLNQLGVYKPPTYDYSTEFEVAKTGYQKRLSMSQEVKPGAADRFSVKIAMKKSSRHRFSATVRDISGNIVESPPIDMTSFIPRSCDELVNSAFQGTTDTR